MSHTNRYYIVKAEDPNLKEIEAVIVGLPTTQRYSIDKTLIEEILEALDNSEWQEPIPTTKKE